MPSEPHRASKKAIILHHRPTRSTASDAGPVSEDDAHWGTRQSKGLRLLWKRRRTVTPAAFRSFIVAEQQSTINTNVPATTQRVDNDPNENIVFLNNSVEFDLRSYFFKKQKSGRTTDRLERSAISQSSVNSHRRHTHGYTSSDNSYKRETIGTKSEVVDPSDVLAAKQSNKSRRRLRAKEELCIVLPRSTARGRTRSQKSWFLGPGFIGREPGEGTLVVTKDKSMDVVHAEISVAGDDYFVRDAQSMMGSFLCLSTRYRHYPQRDGFRLRNGDVFRIGPATSLRVVELQTSTEVTSIQNTRSALSRSNSSSSLIAMTPEPAASKAEINNSQASELDKTSSSSNAPSLKRMSTVEELRLLAADIEDELMNDDGRSHLKPTPRCEANTDTKTPQPSSSARLQPRQTVHFSDTPPLMSDGSVFLGSRYIRSEVKDLHYREPSQVEDADDDMIKQLVGSEHDVSPTDYSNCSHIKVRRPAFIRLVIFQHDPTKASIEPPNIRDTREVTLSGQTTFLIGSSAACDVRIFPSEGIEIRAVHARIFLDGSSFVLEDVSFENDPRRQTRVLIAQRPVRVTRGDWLLLGKCALYITTAPRAFGLDRRPDMKEAAMRLDVLRLSKRKPRTRGLFVPVGFRLHSSSGSGASSGGSTWGGSSGGPVTFGKGRDCDAQVFTASLATEQFSVQLERGTCWLTPKPTGINAGTYFLIGRDEVGPLFLNTAADNAEESKRVEVVKHTSKPLLLSEGCVFRCGGCELEVMYSKSANAPDAKSIAFLEEQEHIQFLCAMPWLQPIASDLKTITNIARCGQRLKLGVGDLIYAKGDATNFVFIVISGEVSLHIAMPNGGHNRDDQMVEKIAAGGFFGEISLLDPFEPCASPPNCDDLEHLETAKAASACELLAIAREDICGYLKLYMDIIRAHLRHDRCRDRIIRIASSCVPWLQGISLQEMRMLSSHAELVVYPAGSNLFEDGKLFVPATFSGGNTFQLRDRDGLLVLRRGDVQVVRSKNEIHHRRTRKMYHEEDLENERQTVRSVNDIGDESDEEPDEWWSPMEPVIAMSSNPSPSVLSFCDLSFRLEAKSTTECYFVAAVHLAHFYEGMVTNHQQTPRSEYDPGGVAETQPPLKRGNSQVVTSALHNEDFKGDDDNHNALDGSDGEGDTTAVHRWRRKKRNKHLLEQTVQQTKTDVQIPNALVMYVLAGAQRGDIHVVRNVASIGGLLSGADIELNDRYVSSTHAIIEYHDGRYWLYDNGSKWGTFVRLEQDNAVDINPGDVFLAGEVEFTCLASYPERNKPSMCCIM